MSTALAPADRPATVRPAAARTGADAARAEDAAAGTYTGDPFAEDGPGVTIEPKPGLRLVDWRELVEYRDLLWFLTWRGIKTRYAQSSIGVGWAVIQPLASALVFTVIFGRLASLESAGAPYLLFALAGLVPWTYFANCLTEGTASLTANANMISKVYFPRIVLPLAAALARLVDFAVGLVVLAGAMAWFGVLPGPAALLLPALIAILGLTAVGAACWLTALAIQFRDVQYAAPFLVQLLMYAAPVVYSAQLVPERYRLAWAVNPLVGVIEGFRAALLGTREVPWAVLAVSAAGATALAVSGVLFFRSRERIFADVA